MIRKETLGKGKGREFGFGGLYDFGRGKVVLVMVYFLFSRRAGCA
jgi:hypothetical protein